MHGARPADEGRKEVRPPVSFKHKLVAFFVVLALLPLAAAFWGFNAAAERSESRRVDARLEAGLRAALASYQDRLAAAGRTAERLAADKELQRALARHDEKTLRLRALDVPNVRIRAREGAVIGDRPSIAGERRVNIVSPDRRLLGTVTAYVPLNAQFVEQLRRQAALEEDDRLVVAHDGMVVGGLSGISGTIPVDSKGIVTLKLDGREYRALTAGLLSEPAGASLAVLSPTGKLRASTRNTQQRLLLGLAASLFLIGAMAYALGRGIVSTLAQLSHAAHELAAGRLGERVPVRGTDEFAKLGQSFNDMAQQLEERLEELERERNRLREATARLGEALAATHDPEQLLRVLVETAVQATGAAHGVIVDDEGRLIEVGTQDAGAKKLRVPLSAGRVSFGTLELAGDQFDDDARETAVSLVGHAVIALENARLHRIVERQALVDGLTGLANRRHAEEALVGELARAERFANPLSVVIADLDDFKAVNDTHGHPTGDAVLRAFADVLRETLREIDVAARWGGEEFALLLPGTDLQGAVHVAERVRAALADRAVLTPEGAVLRVTASFGVASYPDGASADALVAAADEALYEAKRAGKNRVLASGEAALHP
jgi:diguanylate cyclase (GGDEF)-like protein